MNDERRNQAPNLRGVDGDGIDSHGNNTGNDSTAESTGSQGPSAGSSIGHLPPEQAQEQQPATRLSRGTPGEANPALAETEAYGEGKISTAEFLRARGSAETQVPGAMEHRDKGFEGRPPHHGSPAPPVRGVNSDADLYDAQERHNMHEEPEMHVFAPRMLNIPSEEKKGKKERKKRKEKK